MMYPKRQTLLYPVGQQSFEQIRRGDFIYIDKTSYIDRIIRNNQYYFLGRPRRFGKSLFLSTLKCFFEGKRDLFKGLSVESMPWDWEPYPVLMLDLNISSYCCIEDLHAVLDASLKVWEAQYGIGSPSSSFGVRFKMVIEEAARVTGKGVVILVDEYDKPLVSSLHDTPTFEAFRNLLSEIYSSFKSGADYIRLVMLTGVSRFGKLTVFSGLNNIQDISFDNAYDAICGITEAEMLEYFTEGVGELCGVYGVSRDEMLDMLKQHYDGYRFSSRGRDIYNPFSLLNVFSHKEFGNYWISSGTPSLLLHQLKRFNVDLSNVFGARCKKSALEGLDLNNPEPLALLYQTGYLSIRAYDMRSQIFTLDLPNNEVKEGFLSYLLPAYATVTEARVPVLVFDLAEDFRNGEYEAAMAKIQSLFGKVSYKMEVAEEKNLHNALLMLMLLLGMSVETEYCTSDGRIDLFIRTERFYYILELKLDHSAKDALAQINCKDYALPFRIDGRIIIKIGISFSTEQRTITEWIAEVE